MPYLSNSYTVSVLSKSITFNTPNSTQSMHSNRNLAYYEKVEGVQVIDFKGVSQPKIRAMQTCQRSDWSCQIKSLLSRFLHPKTL